MTIAGTTAVGSHTFTITATNGAGTATQSFTLTVSAAAAAQVDILVNNRPTTRAGNNFSVFAACGESRVTINVMVFGQPNATVYINGVAQNPLSIDLPNYGDNRFTVTVRAPGGDQNYTLTVNRLVPWEQLVVMRWDNTLSIINNPENNGGFSFTSYRWFRNGQQFNTAQWWSAGPNGEFLDTIFEYEAEATTAGGITLRTCPTIIRLRGME